MKNKNIETAKGHLGRTTINVLTIIALLVSGFFVGISPAKAVTGTFTASQTVASVTGSTVPAVTLAGGANAINGTVPAVTFSGGANAANATVPAITFAGGVTGVAATATTTIPAGLAATATDHSITIDGVVIDLGTSAQTAIQIASTIAGTNFSTGTSYIANGAYTASNGGTATVTFTRTATGTAGNAGLTIADANYTTTNGVAASATVTIPGDLPTNAPDHLLNIDGVSIDLGTVALTASGVADSIANGGNDFSTGTSYQAGAYTVTNIGADLTFTRTATGTAGNNGLTTSDANYTSGVRATRTLTVVSVPANGVTLTIGNCVVTFNTAATTELNCNDNLAAINTTTNNSASTVATRLRSLLNLSDTGHGGLTVTNPGGNDVSFTTTGAETSATVITTSLSAGASITLTTVNITGVIFTTSTIPAITFAGGVNLVTNSVPAITFAGGINDINATVPAITFTGGVTAVAATASTLIPSGLPATATDHSITIDGVVINLGTAAQTAIQIASTIAGTNFSTGTSYVANGAYTASNGGTATVTFTRTATGTAGNNGLTIADANYTTTNAAAATVTVAIIDSLAANGTDHSVTIDGVSIDLGTSALTANQVAAAIAANPFTGKDYTVTNPSGANLTFTKNSGGTGGNVALTIQDSSYTKTNAVAATVTVVIPGSLPANATDHSITIDGVTIDLGTSALTANQVAAAIASNPFTGKDYTVINPSGADLTYTKSAGGTAGNVALTIQDPLYGTTAQVVTFTPASVTSGETFRATINGANYNYTANGGSVIATVVAALVPLMDANSAVDCADTGHTLITCTASVAGTAFTFAATVLDNTPPTLTSVHIASNNANPAQTKVGDTITLTFSSSESIQTPVVTLAGHAASVSGTGPYSASYITTIADADGPVAFTIDFSDLAGNAGTQVTTVTDSSSVAFDKTAPIVNAGIDKTANVLFNQVGSASDSGSSVNTFAWTKFSGPGTITFGSSNAAATTVSADTDGTYVLRLTAADNAGNSTFSDMTLIWTTNNNNLDFSANVTHPDSDHTSLVLNRDVIALNNVAGVTVSLTIPHSTTIISDSSWDGNLSLPVAASDGAGTTPSGFRLSGKLIELGSPGHVLIFDHPVLITISGLTGVVAYRAANSSVWVAIPTCGGSYDFPLNPSSPDACSISNSSDTKIITFHFSTFTTLISNISQINGPGPYPPFVPLPNPVAIAPIPDPIPQFPSTGQGLVLLPSGTLVKTASNDTVYMVVNGKLRAFNKIAIFRARGLKFSNIKIISSDQVTAENLGRVMGYPDGTVIRGSGPTLFRVSGDAKVGIPSMAVFRKLKLSLNKVVRLSDAELATYDDGGVAQ